MQIDKDRVTAGDDLYDVIAKTYVKVTEVRGDELKVKYPSGQQSTFTGAVFNGIRRLYWHNPIIILPRKDGQGLLKKLKMIAEVLSNEAI